jgi:bifunctional DNase/RNase
MKVSALTVDPLTGVPLAILTDDMSGTSVPVGIGLGEASAIAAELDSIDLERPMTHQLMSELLRATGARVVRVELREMSGGRSSAVFGATVALELADGSPVEREARPSDALALALRSGAPIWVERSMVERLSKGASSWPLGVGRARVRRRRRAATAPSARVADSMPDGAPEDLADAMLADDGPIDDPMFDDLARELGEDGLIGGEADAVLGDDLDRSPGALSDPLVLERLGPEAFGKWKM